MIRRCIILCGWLARAAGLGADVEHYHQTLRISEFMAVNQSGIQDEDGDRSDWIEIHNPTAAAVSLEGWFLTDAAANKTQWQFPATNLLAGAHLVVFASDKNRANAGAPLHANFKLSGAGEYLGLTMPDGVTVASEYAPLFPPQAADVSCGLTPATNPPAILVPPGSSARTLVPSGPIDDAWRLQGFEPDAAWPVTPLPAGYETIGEPIAANILFVVDTNANAGLAPGDAAVLDRLTAALGHAVTVADDNAARTADAAGRDLVVVSSTVSSSAITSKFRDVAVPVINWERSLVDDFRIGATPPSTTSASHVVVTPAGAGHPAAG
ncbi:MAG TPA: lamin tail domain-containing protein, partial [Candidatus Paceibacterota bacterium]|nr:lamin tail domain-containing protein [Candidatus Paceibacterota bacterium]